MFDSDVPLAQRVARTLGQELLAAEDVTVPGAIEGVDLTLREGEILGVAGLVGSGRSTLLRALAGLEPKSTGRLRVRGKHVPWPRTVRHARALGIALLPEDRKGQGLVLGLTAMENVVMGDLSSVTRMGLVSPQAMHAAASRVVGDFGFSTERLRTRVRHLSGGNQQKLLLARWKHSRPLILLADEPTRGIDVGAKDEITTALEAMAEEGIGIVLVSSELAEVAAVSDQVLVLSRGSLVATLSGSNGDITVSEMLHAAFAVEVES
jgi:ABC-type sugar transport system ATPase subunit